MDMERCLTLHIYGQKQVRRKNIIGTSFVDLLKETTSSILNQSLRLILVDQMLFPSPFPLKPYQS